MSGVSGVEQVFGRLVCLLRGPLDAELERTAIGQRDVPLGDRAGDLEPEAVRNVLAFRPDRVLSSDLLRCRGTASAISERQDVPLGVHRNLRPRRFGAWQGRSWSEVVTRDPEAATAFLADFAGARPPGGETLPEVAARVWRPVAEAFRRHRRGTIALVAHTEPLRTLIAAALGLPLASRARVRRWNS